MNGILGRPSIVLAACVAGTGLVTASPGSFITVAQREAYLSARAPRTADISADGRSVAFESRARLVAADEDDRPDIYVLDRTTGLVTLESVKVAMADAGSEFTFPRISGDEHQVSGDDSLRVGRALERRWSTLGPHCALAHAASTLSMLAPSARRRSSMRS